MLASRRVWKDDTYTGLNTLQPLWISIDQAIYKFWRGLKCHADMDWQNSGLMLPVEESGSLCPLPGLRRLFPELHTRKVPILVWDHPFNLFYQSTNVAGSDSGSSFDSILLISDEEFLCSYFFYWFDFNVDQIWTTQPRNIQDGDSIQRRLS